MFQIRRIIALLGLFISSSKADCALRAVHTGFSPRGRVPVYIHEDGSGFVESKKGRFQALTNDKRGPAQAERCPSTSRCDPHYF